MRELTTALDRADATLERIDDLLALPTLPPLAATGDPVLGAPPVQHEQPAVCPPRPIDPPVARRRKWWRPW